MHSNIQRKAILCPVLHDPCPMLHWFMLLVLVTPNGVAALMQILHCKGTFGVTQYSLKRNGWLAGCISQSLQGHQLAFAPCSMLHAPAPGHPPLAAAGSMIHFSFFLLHYFVFSFLLGKKVTEKSRLLLSPRSMMKKLKKIIKINDFKSRVKNKSRSHNSSPSQCSNDL